MPKLVFKNPGSPSLRVFDLEDGTYSVGRAPSCRLIVPHVSVSSRHCEILVHRNEVIVRDRESKNGTFVDGIRVAGQMPVRGGQIIRFGTVEVELELGAVPDLDDETYESAVFEHRRYVNREPAVEPDSTTAPENRVSPQTDSHLSDATVSFRGGDVRHENNIPIGTPDAGRPKVFRRLGLYSLVLLVVVAVALVWSWRRGL